MIRGRLRRGGDGGEGGSGGEYVEIDPGQLTGLFAAPRWLRDLGVMSWLLVGVGAFLVGAVWLLSLTDTIVIPVATAAILAAVLSPLVGYLERRRVPRGLATLIVFLLIAALSAGMVVLILAGISSEAGNLTGNLEKGAGKIQGWLEDAGVNADSARKANSGTSESLSDGFHALLKGVVTGVESLGSIAVFLSFTALSLIFLLKDGPMIRGWAERHLGVPQPLAHAATGHVIDSLRGYFTGVTAIAAFNGIVIGLGAWLLGVPLAGSIAVVNFVAAYIPYVGAWSAGAFTVLIALGAEGPEVALGMAVIALLANGMLQQLIQPIAFGATLGIHPLAVLIVTIAGGALFGTIGLVLAAPLTASAVRIADDLSKARARAPAEPAEAAEPT